jgi:hypothetical protein
LPDCATIEYFLNPVCDWSVKGSPGFPVAFFLFESGYGRSEGIRKVTGNRSNILLSENYLISVTRISALMSIII